MVGSGSRWALAIIVAAYLIMGTVYSVVTPVFEAPDESLHFFVIKHIVDHGTLPVQRAEARDLWAQEGSQPPLYYLVGALVVSWIDLSDAEDLLWRNPQANIGDPTNAGNKNVYVHSLEQDWPWHGSVLAVHVLRFCSLAMGAVTVLLTWHIARLVHPRQTILPLAVAAVTASIPQFLFITSSVSNDNAMTLMGALVLYLLLRGLRSEHPERREGEGVSAATQGQVWRWIGLGIALGLSLLAKLSALALLALTGVTIALVVWHRRSWRFFWRVGLAVGLPVLAIAGWWYVRNAVLYGEPTGLTAMWQVVGRRGDFGQDLWGEFRALRYSFWGLFGWFSIAMPGWVYRVMDVISLLALVGLGLEIGRWLSLGLGRGAWIAFRYRVPEWGAAYRPLAFGLMWLWLAMVSVSLIRWTSLTHGTQGRLLFPALAPLALFFLLGLRAWFLPRTRDAASVVAGVCVWALAGIAPWLWIAPWYERPAQLERLPEEAIPFDLAFGEAIVLRGVGFDQEFVQPGEPLHVWLYWSALHPMAGERETMVVLRLVDPLGGFLGVEDAYPGMGTFPTSLWPVGGIVAGQQYVRVADDADTPTIARLSVALVDAGAGEALALHAPGEGPPIIGRIKVVPRRWPKTGRGEALACLGCGTENGGVVLAASEWTGTARLGDDVSVRLVWRVDSPPQRDYAVFVHLVDGDGNARGYGDGAPRGGRYPTWAWARGEVIEDVHIVHVDAGLPRGDYRLKVGLYDADGRVAAYKVGGERWPDDAVDLGPVEVR